MIIYMNPKVYRTMKISGLLYVSAGKICNIEYGLWI